LTASTARSRSNTRLRPSRGNRLYPEGTSGSERRRGADLQGSAGSARHPEENTEDAMEWVKTEWVVPRMGFYFLPEAEGENEVPERPLDGRKVAKYWREMHEERGARKKRRQEAFPGPEAP